ncbi:hypothetical protein JEQ21_04350 [Streptococcus sp. 121]|uniref:hypothetical protein n=1 Tax=Streptococcus sp. 121 TaxID=2797637 RepID=UPI0018F0EA1A|nr:hypothetical protein [Streptococcus sp. 121]MBJ6745703.1 hypothetical protein [Streptococcus sp. 121]
MKKLLYSTVTLAALFAVAAPVLANETIVPEVNNTGKQIEAIPFKETLPMPDSAQNVEATDVETSGPAIGEGRVVVENGKYYWVIQRENGYDKVELTPDQYTIVNGEVRPDIKVPLSKEAGPANAEESKKEDSKETKESKSTDAAVKSAVEAAKKDAAKKDGAKKLPNTAAVK